MVWQGLPHVSDGDWTRRYRWRASALCDITKCLLTQMCLLTHTECNKEKKWRISFFIDNIVRKVNQGSQFCIRWDQKKPRVIRPWCQRVSPQLLWLQSGITQEIIQQHLKPLTWALRNVTAATIPSEMTVKKLQVCALFKWGWTKIADHVATCRYFQVEQMQTVACLANNSVSQRQKGGKKRRQN